MKRYLLFPFLFAGALSAQTQIPPGGPGRADAQLLKEKYALGRARAEARLQRDGLPVRYETPDGRTVEAVGVDANGQVMYNTTLNLGSAQTISTNKVWPGGASGTSLTGAGMNGKLGEWDGNGVFSSHQELVGRVTQGDGASTYNNHATHVAGTMIAAGVNNSAKGMAYGASLVAYEWLNAEAEMQLAASSGMLVSNHSYGSIAGWYLNSSLGRWEWYGDASVNSLEDYKYGYYDQQAADWDNIAYSNPYYLICKAAGNDRGMQLSGSSVYYYRNASGVWTQSSAPRNTVGYPLGYDCVQTYSTAKNILTVGAVNKQTSGYSGPSSISMSSFSGWGPTDDGRIKPDVVAAGVNITSSYASSTSAYGTTDGTSMASPAATASALLIQQHFANVKGKFMRASTLKGLIIHTADECGLYTGPDYQYGWGLMNTAKAVRHITDSAANLVSEQTLANGSTYTQAINSDGASPLRITLSWTDKPGVPVAISLDPTDIMLVNDLDIRLKRVSDNAVFNPYILNPASPGSAPTTGDNFRDNVEQIYLPAPQAGAYVLTVSHKGTLYANISQNFSLLVSGMAAPPVASLSASKTIVCTGKPVTFTDLSSGFPTSRTWYFPGGTPSVSTAANPSVIYNAPGKYAVAMRTFNGLGSDSVYYPAYVTAGGISPLPFSENFEPSSLTASSWTIDNPDNDTTWRLATTSGTSPGNRSYTMPFYNYGAQGARDGLISPPLNLASYQSASLTFKHAYTRADNNSKDSLIVYVSTNCGGSWTRVLARGEGGTGTFATAPNTTYLQSSLFSPTSSSNWCSGGTGPSCYTVNLNAYAGQNNVLIKFEGYNDWGNNLYIDNVTVTGGPKKPTAAFAVAQQTICAGDSLQLTDSSANFPSSWLWTFSGGGPATSTKQHPKVAYSVPGTYTIKLRVTNAGGTDSVTRTNYITVLALPSKPTITGHGATTFCAGDSVRITSDSTAASYQWVSNGLPIAGASDSVWYAKVSGQYRVQAINSSGCKALSSNTIAVTVNPLPAAPTITSNITGPGFCADGTPQLTSSATSSNQWYKNGAAIPGATSRFYLPTDSGTYSVRTTTPPCPSEMSAPRALAKYPKPAAISLTGPASSNFNKTESYSVPSISGSVYVWTITNGTIVSGQGTSAASIKWGVADTGFVSVRETASTGCKGDATGLKVDLSIGVGLSHAETLADFTVFPNPATDHLQVSLTSSSKQRIAFRLINLPGQVLISEQAEAVPGPNVFVLKASGLAPGMYLLETESSQGTRQVVKVRIR